MGLLWALLLTILIECGIVALQSRDRAWVGYMALVNVVTNPTLNIIRYVFHLYSDGATYLLEIAVVLAEAVMIYYLRKTDSFKVKRLSFPRSLLYSFIINCISYFSGVLIYRVI